MDPLKIYFLLNMGICLIALVVCQRVLSHTLDGLGFASWMLGTYEKTYSAKWWIDGHLPWLYSTIRKKSPTDSKKYLSHEKEKNLLLSVILVG